MRVKVESSYEQGQCKNVLHLLRREARNGLAHNSVGNVQVKRGSVLLGAEKACNNRIPSNCNDAKEPGNHVELFAERQRLGVGANLSNSHGNGCWLVTAEESDGRQETRVIQDSQTSYDIADIIKRRIYSRFDNTIES